MTAKKICLIDGSGYIFRAFYGLPPLNAPDGTPVNAVYGFTNMFLKLTSKIGCAFCWNTRLPGAKFRKS